MDKSFSAFIIVLLSLVLGLSLTAGCRRATDGEAGGASIQNVGSDTIVNLALAWAEAYTAQEITGQEGRFDPVKCVRKESITGGESGAGGHRAVGRDTHGVLVSHVGARLVAGQHQFAAVEVDGGVAEGVRPPDADQPALDHPKRGVVQAEVRL